MSKLTAFKVAFLSRCAEEGLNIDQIHQRVKEAVAKAEKTLEKKAILGPLLTGVGAGIGASNSDILFKMLGGVGGAIGGFINSPKNTPGIDLASAGAGGYLGYNNGKILPLMLGGGALLAGGGLAAGKMLAEAGDDPMAVDEVKQQELINEYKRLSNKAKRQAKFRQLKGI